MLPWRSLRLSWWQGPVWGPLVVDSDLGPMLLVTWELKHCKKLTSSLRTEALQDPKSCKVGGTWEKFFWAWYPVEFSLWLPLTIRARSLTISVQCYTYCWKTAEILHLPPSLLSVHIWTLQPLSCHGISISILCMKDKGWAIGSWSTSYKENIMWKHFLTITYPEPWEICSICKRRVEKWETGQNWWLRWRKNTSHPL